MDFFLVNDLCVNLCGGKLGVSQEFTGSVDIGPHGKEECGKAVPGSMESYLLLDSSLDGPFPNDGIGPSGSG